MAYTPEEKRDARRAAKTKWQRKNKEREAANKAAWVKANPDKVAAQYQRRLPKALQMNEKYRLARYGLTTDDYARMLKEQGGKCAICAGIDTIKLAVDHCHKSGRVRGLLCGPCNRGLGSFRDNPNALVSAAKYLHTAAIEQLEDMLT